MSELRRSALMRVSDMRSARAAEVLMRAFLDVREREDVAWESSDGTVRGVDVHVLLDGYAMGLLSWHPSVRDTVVEAIAATAPGVIAASVVDLRFAWALRERTGVDSYRDAPLEHAERRSSRDVKRALAAFLGATGDHATAHAVEQCTLVIIDGGEVLVSIDPARVQPALCALLGPATRAVSVLER